MKITRRHFVAAGAALLVPGPAGAAAAAHAAFPAISGRRMHGLLLSADPERDRANVAALRSDAGYLRPLTYTSTDRNKAAFATALIDYAAASMQFAAQADIAPNLPANSILMARGRFPELDELAAFLTGCAYAGWTGSAHPLKRMLAQRLATSIA